MSFVLLGIKTDRSYHFSILRMTQTQELAKKRVFGVLTFLITDYLFSCKFNSILSSKQVYLLLWCSFAGADSVFLTRYKFIVRPWFI